MIRSVEKVEGLEQNKVYSGLWGGHGVELDNGIKFEINKNVRGFGYPILATYSTDNNGKVVVYELDQFPINEILKHHGATEITGADPLVKAFESGDLSNYTLEELVTEINKRKIS